jgi:excisionase family DNA binding protein
MAAELPEVTAAPFLTVAEVAGRMRVSKMTVYRLVHSGELPAVRFGRSFRMERAAVEELIRAAHYEVPVPAQRSDSPAGTERAAHEL